MTQSTSAERSFTDDEATLAHVMARRVAHGGDRPWILAEAGTFTYRDVDSLACRVAGALARLGVTRGDTVLLMLNNCIEYIALWCALTKIGAIEVPVNCHYKGRLLWHLLYDLRARVMIVDEEYLPRLAAVANELTILTTLVVYGGPPQPHGAALIGSARIVSYTEFLNGSGQFAPAPAAPWDHAAIMYTSGTTGPSKGVVVTHGHAFEYARGVTDMLEMKSSNVYYAPLPLFHIAGQWAVVYAAAIAGAAAVLPDTFSPSRYWSVCRRYKATCSFLLGAMASLLYRQPRASDDADNTLKRVLVVPLIPEVEDFKNCFGLLVSTTWGAPR